MEASIPWKFSPTGIAIEGDVARGQQYVPRATALMARLRERLRIGGVSVGKDFARLADDAYCYAIIAGTVQRCVIVVDDASAMPGDEGKNRITPIVPDFYSGSIIRGYMVRGNQEEPNKLDSFIPTDSCAALHGIAGGLEPREKLAVEPYSEFDNYLVNKNKADQIEFTQYVKLKPTMFSGRMRQVVQLLMGFGRQHIESIYDTTPPKLKSKDVPPVSRYEREVSKTGRQIRYDWRWFRTHGIAVGADGKFWLVEIGATRGVVAMPLPINPVTESEAFRDKLGNMGDRAGIRALDEFGGFPTGEAIKSGNLESWFRAGRVIQLATPEDVEPFYRNLYYSSDMGWAFNDSGTEAVNTCYGYGSAEHQVGYTYAIRFDIGAMTEIDDPISERTKRRIYDRMGIGSGADRTVREACIWKVDRLSQDQADDLLRWPMEPDEFVEALDAIQCQPLAPGEARVRQTHRGALLLSGAQIKFPEPLVGTLITHDLKPNKDAYPETGSGDADVCDTIMHTFFIEDELHWVRYAYDNRTVDIEIESDFGDCNYVGTFTETHNIGSIGVPPMFYSNIWDHREEMPERFNKTTMVSADLGYTSVFLVTNPFPWNIGWLRRRKTFRQCTESITDGRRHIGTAINIPFHDRCSYYYTLLQGNSSGTRIHSCSYTSLVDPNQCHWWVNDCSFTGWCPGQGCCWRYAAGDVTAWELGEHPMGCGQVLEPHVTFPEYVDGGLCPEHVDSGQWCDVCDNAKSMAYEIPLPPLPETEWETNVFKVFRNTWIVSSNVRSPMRIETDLPFTNGELARGMWFRQSPHPDDFDAQYLDLTHNVLGTSDAIRFWTYAKSGTMIPDAGWQAPTPSHVDIRGENTNTLMRSNKTTFIGVIP